jgi:hypothetical protein
VNLEYHKGEMCVVNGMTFCQEGYCSECQIDRQRKQIKFSKIHEVDPETLKKNVN